MQNVVAAGAVAPVSPALAIVPIVESHDLDEFLKIIQDTFQAASTMLAAMQREDMKRPEEGKPLIDKGELIKLAKAKEGFLLEFEAKIRAAGQKPDARPTENPVKLPDAPKLPRARSPERKLSPQLEERLGPLNKDVRDKTRPSNDKPNDNRLCHICGKPRQLARNCPNKTTTPTPLGQPPKKADNIAQHKTDGHTCEACGKLGHT